MLDHFFITGLNSDTSLGLDGLPQNLQTLLNKEPGDSLPKAFKKWSQLGPLSVKEILDSSRHGLQTDKPIGLCKAGAGVVGQLSTSGYCDGIVKYQD